MKIFTNENNPASLKLLVSARFANKDVDVEVVSLEDKRFQSPRRLPVLQLDSGANLFSANSGARYLFPPKSGPHESTIDQWLEFEAIQLSPNIYHTFNSTGKIDTNSSNNFNKHLITLDAALKGKKYLLGDVISVADICIWASLFPIVAPPQPPHHIELFSDKTNLTNWFGQLQDQPHFKSAVEKLCTKTGIWSLESFASAIWFPPSDAINQTGAKQKAGLQQVNSIDSQASPTKEAVVSEEELKSAADSWHHGSSRKQSAKPRVSPVLPIKGERNVLITSALPYVNNVPHLGNIIGCVLSADVFARFCRLRNCNTLYVSGTDEYGTATETKALEEGLTPQQICDKYYKIHESIYSWFNIEFDHFGRTTTKQQTSICQEMFLTLHKQGLMTTQSMEQLLCQKCDRYLADRFVEGTCPKCQYEDARGDQCDGCGHLINATELINPRCKVCSTAPVIRNSEQFFLELPKVEPSLRTWLDTVTQGWSHNAKVITRSWLKDGLKARCITRDLKWGIPVPLAAYSDKVFYVWFDAPIGYLSMTSCYTDQWKRWWQPEEPSAVTLYQFMAKDNVPFHSVMFPTTLIGANKGYTLVSHLMATEYLNYEDGKFSKSRGVGVFGTDARETGIVADVWRFYLLYIRPENQDSSFSWVDLATKNNSELLNNLGNFINRALMFAEKNFDGIVPRMTPGPADFTLLALVNRELQEYIAALEKTKLRDGIRHILSISRHGNQYMQSQQPWVLLKGNEDERIRAGTVIGLCANICCLLASLLHPYMPATSATLQQQLNCQNECRLIPSEVATLLPEGHRLGKPAPLFTKIELDHIETLKKRFAGSQKSRATPDKGGDASRSVAQLVAAVAQQGELVRQVKSSGAPKGEWQPHVAVLLELKKQLAAAEVNEKGAAVGMTTVGAGDVTALQGQVAKQADLVREMKTGGASKADVAPHVATLLDLKKQLAAAEASEKGTSVSVTAVSKPAVSKPAVSKPAVGAGDAASLEAQVAKQADLVREMKTGGASKADVAPHVATLLDLKKQLATAQGTDTVAKPVAAGGKTKNKSKK